jgi:hypothetical protein
MSVSAIDKPSDATDGNVDTVAEFFHHLTAERVPTARGLVGGLFPLLHG